MTHKSTPNCDQKSRTGHPELSHIITVCVSQDQDALSRALTLAASLAGFCLYSHVQLYSKQQRQLQGSLKEQPSGGFDAVLDEEIALLDPVGGEPVQRPVRT